MESFKKGTRQAFDMACFLSTELGFYYASNEYMANHHDISERTMRYRLTELVELGQVVKVHKRAKNVMAKESLFICSLITHCSLIGCNS